MTALTTGNIEHRAQETIVVNRTVTTRTEHKKGWSNHYGNVPDYELTAMIEVFVDYAAIVRKMARKAMTSKSKKSQALHGAIVVRAVDVLKTKEYPR